MASATNFLMVFLAIEAASFPSYALAGFNKRTGRSSEASLKYVLFGAASSALMVYGLSMLYGQCGTLSVAGVSQMLATEGIGPGMVLGIFGVLVGIGFKLSAVPVHFWCPDVFEGASIEITTFLSVASKGGAIALLMRVMMTLGHYADGVESHGVLVGIGAMFEVL
jgi:NADH-quinone oxidoreductase subunit N